MEQAVTKADLELRQKLLKWSLTSLDLQVRSYDTLCAVSLQLAAPTLDLMVSFSAERILQTHHCLARF
jgi:hypothetical protein